MLYLSRVSSESKSQRIRSRRLPPMSLPAGSDSFSPANGRYGTAECPRHTAPVWSRSLKGTRRRRGPPPLTLFVARGQDKLRFGPRTFVTFHQDLEERGEESLLSICKREWVVFIPSNDVELWFSELLGHCLVAGKTIEEGFFFQKMKYHTKWKEKVAGLSLCLNSA